MKPIPVPFACSACFQLRLRITSAESQNRFFKLRELTTLLGEHLIVCHGFGN